MVNPGRSALFTLRGAWEDSGKHLPEHMGLHAEEGLKVPLRLPHELQHDSVILAQPYMAQQPWLHTHGPSPPLLSGLALLFKEEISQNHVS